jgi:hypothetical protein
LSNETYIRLGPPERPEGYKEMNVVTRSKWLIGAAGGLAATAGLTMMSVAPNALASASTPAASATPAAIGGTVKVDTKSILAYWTPSRRATAINADVAVAAAPRTQAIQSGTKQVTGKAGQVAGGLPHGVTASSLKGVRSTAMIPNAFSYPFPYDSFNVPVGSYQKYPWTVNGKVFFTNDGLNYVCSATVVPSVHGSTNENELWTAGHCVANTESNDGHVDSSFEFVPAYNGNKVGAAQDPLGVYTWSGAWETTTAWLNNRDLSEDEAALLMNPNANGQILGNVTGWAGFAWNQSTDQQFVAFGYPAASPYSGKFQVTDLGASAVLDTGIGGAGSAPIGIGNPMTGGSSGGGWMIDWSQTGTGYVNGHNDYKYTSQPLAMYSPYQDTLSNVVRCFGASSC